MKILRCFIIVLAALVAVAAVATLTHQAGAGTASPSGSWLEIIPSQFALSIGDTLTVTVVNRYDGEGCAFHIMELSLYQNSGIDPSLEFISPSVLGPGITHTFLLRAIYTGTSELRASAFGEYGPPYPTATDAPTPTDTATDTPTPSPSPTPPVCYWVWGYIGSKTVTVIVSNMIYREYLPVIKK